MRILRSILGVLLAVMLSQRYKANELDWGSDWAVGLLIKTKQMCPVKIILWIFGQLYQNAFRIPGTYCVGAKWKMEKRKIQDFRKCGDKLCGGWLGGQFYSTLSFLIGSCRSQTLHFIRTRGGEEARLHIINSKEKEYK